jgi:hypothetical protein
MTEPKRYLDKLTRQKKLSKKGQKYIWLWYLGILLTWTCIVVLATLFIKGG